MLVRTSHIAAIINDPVLFGFTKAQVLDAYEHHGERLYSEGEARLEIIVEACRRGFLRIRDYGNSGYSVTLLVLDESAHQRLRAWARHVLDGGVDRHRKADRYACVTITSLGTESTVKVTLEKLATSTALDASSRVGSAPSC